MNNEYTYLDGKVIVSDENGEQTLIEYTDNLDEVLAKENLIESIENRIPELEKEYNQLKKINKKRYIPFTLLFGTFLTTAVPPIIAYFMGQKDVFVTMVDTIFGEMKYATLYSLAFSTCFIPFMALFELFDYKFHKDLKKEERATENQLDNLRNQLEIEKEELIKLKEDKSREHENAEFRKVKIDNSLNENALNDLLSVSYDVGYNAERYYKYLEKGTLEKKLEENYTEEGINFAKDYLEEKGLSLSRKKSRRNKK